MSSSAQLSAVQTPAPVAGEAGRAALRALDAIDLMRKELEAMQQRVDRVTAENADLRKRQQMTDEVLDSALERLQTAANAMKRA